MRGQTNRAVLTTLHSFDALQNGVNSDGARSDDRQVLLLAQRRQFCYGDIRAVGRGDGLAARYGTIFKMTLPAIIVALHSAQL